MLQDSQLPTSRRLAGALVIAAAAMFLSSCAGTAPANPPATDDVSPTHSASATDLTLIDAGEGVPGTPADQGEPFDGTGPSTIYDPAAPETLTVVLFGSGSCPPEPVSYSVGDDGKVTILTDYTGESEMCTKDFSPITYEIATPPEFDPTKGVALEAVQPS